MVKSGSVQLTCIGELLCCINCAKAQEDEPGKTIALRKLAGSQMRVKTWDKTKTIQSLSNSRPIVLQCTGDSVKGTTFTL